MQNPKISVVTVVFNNADSIEKTIKSVLNQTYKNIEYIIVDGGSTDGTLDIINKYKEKIDSWVTQPDKGIYDAMNKGITLTTGEYIYFLNSGDCFFENNVVQKVFKKKDIKNYDLIYGKTYVYSERNNYEDLKKEIFSLKNIRKGRKLNHQSFFLKSGLLKKYKFDLRYKIAADYFLQTQLIKEPKIKSKFLDFTICKYDGDGISSKLNSVYRENALIIKESFGNFQYIKYSIKKLLSLFFLNTAKLLKLESLLYQLKFQRRKK